MRNHIDFLAVLLLAALYASPGPPVRFRHDRIEQKLDQAERKLDMKLRRIEDKHERLQQRLERTLKFHL